MGRKPLELVVPQKHGSKDNSRGLHNSDMKEDVSQYSAKSVPFSVLLPRPPFAALFQKFSIGIGIGNNDDSEKGEKKLDKTSKIADSLTLSEQYMSPDSSRAVVDVEMNGNGDLADQ